MAKSSLRPELTYFSFPDRLPAFTGTTRIIPTQTANGLRLAVISADQHITVDPNPGAPGWAAWWQQALVMPGSGVPSVCIPYQCHLKPSRQMIGFHANGTAFWDVSSSAWEQTMLTPGEPVVAACQFGHGVTTKLVYATASGVWVWSPTTNKSVLEGVPSRTSPKLLGTVRTMAMLTGRLSNTLAVAVNDRIDFLNLDTGDVTPMFTVSDNHPANVNSISVKGDIVLFGGAFNTFTIVGGGKATSRRLFGYDIGKSAPAPHRAGSDGKVTDAAVINAGWEVAVGENVPNGGKGVGLFENGGVFALSTYSGAGQAVAVVGSTAFFVQKDEDDDGPGAAIGQIKLARPKP